MPTHRAAASVVLISVTYALIVLAAVRMLALIHPVGSLLLVECLRASLIFGSAAFTGWLVLWTKRPDGRPGPLLQPGFFRCVFAGFIAGVVVGIPALALGAIVEPTDFRDLVGEMVVILAICGFPLGVALGVTFGLFFRVYASLAFGRAARGEENPFEGAVNVAAIFTGTAAGISSFAHAMNGKVDALGLAMLLAAGGALAVVGRSATSRVVVPAIVALLLPGAIVGVYFWRDASAPAWGTSAVPIVRGQGLTSLASTDHAMCARRASDGRLVCWGSRAGALLGKKSVAYRTPEAAPRLGAVRAFAIAEGRGCAVLEVGDHRAVCWTESDPEPRPVGPPGVVALAIGPDFAVAVTSAGAAWRWGNDPDAGTMASAPELMPGLPPIERVAAGSHHVVALARDGSAYCWGSSMGGECGVQVARVGVTRFEGGPFNAIGARGGVTWLRCGGSWETHGIFGPDRSLMHEDKVRQFVVSGNESCILHENGGVACTRGGQASPNGVLAWGALEIAGSDDGTCAATARELWCWSGYSLAFAFLQ